jgi:general secretion pathway protein A
MYKAFYNLNRSPFSITPDPSFLFPTKRHNEALASLYYGISQQKGFLVMTGEIGTGKTLILRCLLHLFKGKDIACAYVFNGRLTSLEFLHYIATDFGLTVSGKSKSEVLLELSRYLISRQESRSTTVLIVDEAHHLSFEVLEEIRLLTNLETARQKLLQIVLVGQPELDEKLDSMELRQLKQRVVLRSRLGQLDLEETIGYIQRRLQVAGAQSNGKAIFPVETIAEIHRYARGTPRLINTISENALITAFARQQSKITPDIIDTVAADLRLDVPYSQPSELMPTDQNYELRQAARVMLELSKRLRGDTQVTANT